MRASVQAVSAIPAGANGNAKGFELTEYMAEASVIDQIDFSNGPVLCKFEAEVRPITNRFGKTTNTQQTYQADSRSTPAPSSPTAS